MSQIELKNAVIKSATLSIEDHGCLSGWLHLDYGGTGQGFGGYNPHSTGHGGGNYAGVFIRRVLEVAGVGRWDQLVGKTIRVEADHGKVYRIGHIVNNDWLNPGEEFGKLESIFSRKK